MNTTILEHARPQHGVVARWQLIAAGVPAPRIDGWVKRRRLERVAHCVYSVPGLCGPRYALAVAVFSGGRHAVASHEAAGELFGWLPHRGPVPDVSVGAGNPGPREDVVLHRVKLPADERTVHDGILVTSPARTLIDLAARLRDRPLEQVLARAFRSELVGPEALAALVTRYRGRPGVHRLAARLAADTSPAFVRSDAEEKFLTLIRDARLPAPRVNSRLRGLEVDFLWAEAHLVVEIDGMAWHSSRAAQLRDRERDALLTAAGFRVLRFTWTDLTERAAVTLARVAMALGRAGMRG